MDEKHFGLHLFWGNHYYFMETDRKNVNDAVSELFAREMFLKHNKYDVWERASVADKQKMVKMLKSSIQPCVFEIKETSTKVKYLSYLTLEHAQDENSSRGGGSIPEKYWEKEVTIFWEEDLTEYFGT